MIIGVVGSSTMGRGLTQHIANCGFEVRLNARRQEALDEALAYIEGQYDFMISRGWLDAEKKEPNMKRIKASTDMSILKDCDVVIEAVVENLDVKRDIFQRLDKACKPEAVLASNTSSLSITELAAVTERPGQVIGMHFFNPAAVMKLVEIIPGYTTNASTVAKIKELSTALQKTPIEVNEAPGFVVNRMLVPMINEAVGIFSEHLETAENIDIAMKLGANHPMGPLALADLIGLDVCLSIMETLHREFGDDKYRPHPLLRKMVRAKKLGVKSGEGFYKYNK
ncbi:MAG: 3-hydroxybutyryl-CoA dehydrogenase [Clostridia bacterium]|nr:3-hydroxybutyryl-CoA dehydrogenase [Clostridia bacterium]